MIEVGHGVHLDEAELAVRGVRASGPGGQHVNKASTAVELRFDVAGSPSLPERVRHRLTHQAAGRINAEGVLIIVAQEHRSQELNRQAAVDRLVALIRKAAEPPPPPRKKTKPSRAARQRRLDAKKSRGGIKAMRGRVRSDD